MGSARNGFKWDVSKKEEESVINSGTMKLPSSFEQITNQNVLQRKKWTKNGKGVYQKI